MKEKLKKMNKWLNKTMPVPYLALYFFVIIILLEGIWIGCMNYQKRYLYGTGEEDYKFTGISHDCYEKKDIGKVCLVEKKVMWYERTDKK